MGKIKRIIALLFLLAVPAYGQENDTTFVLYTDPNLYIPDEDTTGVIDTLAFPIDVEIQDLNVYIGINTYFFADLLTIDVISPWADSVRLLERNPDVDFLNCWFDTDIPEEGPGQLEDYVGHNSSGLWIIQAAVWTGHANFLFQRWGIEVITHPTEIHDNIADSLSFGIISTFPNPANSNVKFDFSLSEGGYTTIDVFDILGRKVGSILSQFLTAGRHSAIWSTSETASGIYYYVLTSNNREAQGRVTLIK